MITLLAGSRPAFLSENLSSRNYQSKNSGELIALKINEDDDEIVLLDENKLIWLDKCYFPKLSEDLFAHLVAWQSWNYLKKNGSKYSLAAIYDIYLKKAFGFGIDSAA